MNIEQEKELLNFLASAGFQGALLEDEIHKNTQLDLPYFTVKHSLMYGEEMMLFDLNFRRDQQFNSYRLERYKATHRTPVVIEHKVVNGVDTAALEEQMKAIAWQQYFKKGDAVADAEYDRSAKAIVDDLNRLSTGQNFDGIKIQRELMFKYWPEHIHLAVTENLKHLHDHSREFIPTETGICNANLAYHIISGRLADLFEKLELMNLGTYPGVDTYPQLERILSQNPDSFELKYSYNQPEGLVEFNIPVSKIDDWYSVETFSTTLIPYPEISHGTFNGVDSGQLELLMRKIDWHDDRQLFILHDDSEPEFLPKVGDVLEQMYRLSTDMAGSEIADLLQLKYWTDASFFDSTMQQSAWDTLAQLPKRIQEFPVEMDAKSTFNLLCGRASLDFLKSTFDEGNWIRLELDRQDEKGHYPITRIAGFGSKELEVLLDLLPLPTKSYYQVRNSLFRGDLVPVTTRNEKKIRIEADPENRSVNLYTPDMRPIPVNLNLDPDWRPKEDIQQVRDQKHQQQKAPKVRWQKHGKRGKGKGL